MIRKSSALGWLAVVLVGACGSKPELVTGMQEQDASAEASQDRLDSGTGIYFPDGTVQPDPGGCEAGSCTTRDSGPPAVCGDGLLNRLGETCDDGNIEPDDGCTANCQRMDNYACPVPGEKCVSTVKCGDGRISVGAETCDDHNADANDGCDATCHLEPGWDCAVQGTLCTPRCGDGILVGDEQCEFYGGAVPTAGAGCSVNCQIEPGWDCNATTKSCAKTVCGNGKVELGEQCDDGAAVSIPFDGCFNCVAEPRCPAGACQAVCGDGKRYLTEACDDGNNRDGDGCSKDCKVETGYMCTDSLLGAAADKIVLPVIFRDFIGKVKDGDTGRAAFAAAQTTAGVKVHPDFNVFFGNGIKGVVAPALGADGRPVYVTPANPGEPANFTGKANYDKWYNNDPVYNRTVVGNITLTPVGTLYVYDSDPFFGPLDGKGFNAAPILDANAKAQAHNYSFTSETHFWFEYGGGEKFDFSGDDDVWVFVNGTLAIDLGGLHSKLQAGFTLDATTGIAHTSYSGVAGTDVDLKLKIGSVYELVMFHAEREEVDSNFKLTLKDFNKPKSTCAPVCGDGIVTRTEVCDDGKNTGEYGGCMPGCKKRGPYCGDGAVDAAHEKCDDGVNLSPYGGCAPGCILPTCGDGIVQAAEQCDDMVLDGKYGGCTAQCLLAPHCGDGVIQTEQGEQCDDGNRTTGDDCDNSCTYPVTN